MRLTGHGVGYVTPSLPRVIDRQLTNAVGSVFQVAGYAIDAAAPPFPAFVFAFALNGFGIALQARVALPILPYPVS